MTKYTDLCARLEAPAVLDSFIDPQSARAAMLEAAAAIRELEAERDAGREMIRFKAGIITRLQQRAEAAEAKVARLVEEMQWALPILKRYLNHPNDEACLSDFENAIVAVRKGATP
jgi:hypothetical protein